MRPQSSEHQPALDRLIVRHRKPGVRVPVERRARERGVAPFRHPPAWTTWFTPQDFRDFAVAFVMFFLPVMVLIA